MKAISTKIGGHMVSITCHSEQLAQLMENSFPLIEPIYHKIDLHINIESGYGTPFLNYDVYITKEPNKITFRRADYLIEASPDYRNATISVHDELALKHALMNLYSSFIVYHNWGLLIHSSCVVDNKRAHIFAGQSGAGKSTAAKLSSPRELLSDEATILKINSSGEITVFDSPFRSEIHANGIGEATHLASIQLLKQAPVNQRVRLKKSDALLQLMDKVFYWSHSPAETKKILILLNTLVQTVPVYELHFQKNNTFWELIS